MRAEIGIELAMTHEAAGQDQAASEAYRNMFAQQKVPSIELRARAGRFYARTGEIAKAAEQGDLILAAEPRNASGLYLKAEGLLAQERAEDARQLLTRAIEVERAAHFLDALGRACESIAKKENDTRFIETAYKAYSEAMLADPKLWNSRFRLGRIQLERSELKAAMATLKSAWDLKRTAEIALLIGSAARDDGDKPGAITWLRESLRLEANADASWLLGQLYADLDKGKEAAQQLDTAVELARTQAAKSGVEPPWLVDAVYLQGKVHYDTGNLRAAKQAWLLFRAMPKKPNSSSAVRVKEVDRMLVTTLRDVK
jgi:tetratricopeptide (TPR) repeat protein